MNRFAHLIQSALSRIVEAGLPGAFALIEDANGSSVYFTAGYADLENQTRITPRTHYRVGSTTKTFTSVVLLQLVEEERLGLQDLVKDLLPNLSIPNADALRLEHLLRMQSGLFELEETPPLKGSLEAHLRPWTLAEVVSLAISQPPLFRPGERFSYCNTNFCILEMIIERKTGHSLAHEIESRITKPLQLGDTIYPEESDLSLPDPYIRGYHHTESKWFDCSKIFYGRGDGGLISTPNDLATFFRALLVEERLLKKYTLGKMMDVIPAPGVTYSYGLGLMADQLSFGRVWGHSGGGYGYNNLPFVNLENGRFAIFLRNGTYGADVPKGLDLDRLRFSPELRVLAYTGGALQQGSLR